MRISFFHLLARSWGNLISALGTTTLAIGVFSVLVPILISAILILLAWRRDKKPVLAVLSEHIKAVVVPTASTLFVWAVLFSVFVARTLYTDHIDLVETVRSLRDATRSRNETIHSLQDKLNAKAGNTATIAREKEQCWSQNILLPPPRTIPTAMSASEAVVFCNKERKAPLTIVVDYDKEPSAAGPIAFSEGRILSAVESFEGKKLFFKLDSPSIKPFQIFIVTVYGNSDKPPLSQNVKIAEINPEQ